jgi:hypothetical protein
MSGSVSKFADMCQEHKICVFSYAKKLFASVTAALALSL